MKLNFLWVHQLMVSGIKATIKSIVLEQSSLPLPNRTFKRTSLIITYSFGRANCFDPNYENSLIISFYDISKDEENYTLIFRNCIELERLKKHILELPLPKNN